MARTKKAHFSQMAQKAKYLAAMFWLSIYSDQVNIEQYGYGYKFLSDLAPSGLLFFHSLKIYTQSPQATRIPVIALQMISNSFQQNNNLLTF